MLLLFSVFICTWMTMFMNQLKMLNKYHPVILIKIKLFKVLNIISNVSLTTYTSCCGEGCSQNLGNVMCVSNVAVT